MLMVNMSLLLWYQSAAISVDDKEEEQVLIWSQQINHEFTKHQMFQHMLLG